MNYASDPERTTAMAESTDSVKLPSRAHDWLRVGASVVEFTPGRAKDAANMKFSTVEKIGKRDVVLANGGRYNVSTLRIKRGTWDSDTELLPVEHERVERARWANERSRRLSRVRHATDEFIKTPSLEAGREVIAATESFLAHSFPAQGLEP